VGADVVTYNNVIEVLNQQEISITASEMLAMAPPEAEISGRQLKQLELLVEDLPWFACGQLLLLKGMKQRQHPLFDDRLPFASLYATSRECLCDYLQQTQAVVSQEPPPVAAATDNFFELMPADTVCEEEVEILLEPTARPVAAAQPSIPTPALVPVSTSERHEQLVDKFLVDNPQKIDSRPDTNRKVSVPLIASEVAPDLASETLAEIYLAQGLFVKAKQVYAKLSLLYPEKKAYFAARLAVAPQPRSTTRTSS
jgi:hypothetical protein